ncbi:MAG TPA: peptide MFS transporter [Patescibacteria group bacterium]|nr:peptide MFS transporter [Patescibacteria group bacterium]
MQQRPADTSTGWFGHPRGLSTLFFTEMWERFSFYGMRAILLLFMTAPAATGGLGWDAAKAGPIYGLYTAMVYLTALPGGWIADRLIGQRRAVLFGGLLIALGHLTLTIHNVGFFYTGLFLIICGTGLLKPNISTMVGALYSEEDKRRDAGFSIFYMGINLGAFISPLVCGFLAQDERFRSWLQGMGLRPESSWHWGFGAATVGMTIGLIQYTLGGRRLGAAGLKPAVPLEPAAHALLRRRILLAAAAAVVVACLAAVVQAAGLIEISIESITSLVGYSLVVVPLLYFGYFFMNKQWSGMEKKRLGAIFLLFLFAALFWSAFEQAGSSLNLFAERFTRNEILGFAFPASWLQSVNSIFIILLAPVFAWLWVTMGRREPSSPAKFSIGMFFVGLGFLVVAFAAMLSGPAGVRVSPWWLITLYLCHTIGELCLSPVGLSTMTKLAPPRVVGQMMGIWFLALSVGNFIGGQVAGLFETLPLPKLFGAVVAVTMACTLICVILIKPIRRLMGGVR